MNETSDEELIIELTKEKWYNFILWSPFFLIPLSIIFSRLLKFSWRLYKVYMNSLIKYSQAKRAGKEGELLKDPLRELGLSAISNYSKEKQAKRIKKEQEQYRKWIQTEQEKLQNFSESADGGELGIRQKADHYFNELRLKTRQSWQDRLSPDAVRRFFSASKYGRIWLFLQVICTAIAIINYVLLTYQIDNAEKRTVKRLDLALAFIFLIDYCIGMYTSEDALRFYFQPSALSDLISVIPPFVYVFMTETGHYVWFLGLLRVLRASRILRTYRLVSFSETEEKRELTILALTLVNFLFLSASIINALEVLQMDEFKIKPVAATLRTWHDSLYYIMVTFSTIGFGDLTPQTIPSRILVMMLIVLVMIFVPLQTGKLTELYNATNQYQRARYTSHRNNAHVIISGVITTNSIVDFCREYFVNDVSGHVIILNLDPPSLEVRRILRHPFYKQRLVYLCGSPLNTADLNRCDARQATGIFFLNSDSIEIDSGEDEQLKVTRGADAEILMNALNVKNSFPGIAIFSQVQDIRSQDLARHCGSDRTICLDEMKMNLLARNCVVPGILTLVMNLVHTYQQMEEDSEDAWMREYQYGAGHQLNSFKFPHGLVNKPFGVVVATLYSSFEITLFAVITKGVISINPGNDYIIKNDDIGVGIIKGGDDTILHMSIRFDKSNSTIGSGPSSSLKKEKLSILTTDEILSSSMIELNIQEDSDTFLPSSTLRSGIIEEQEYRVTSPAKTIVVEEGDISKSLSEHDSKSIFQDHIILCGKTTARGVRNFVQTIRNGTSKAFKANTPIVCLMENVPSKIEGIWEDIVGYDQVFIVKGTPLKKTNLLNVGIPKSKCVVIFTAKRELDHTGSECTPDANSIFIVQMVQEEWPKIKFSVDLVNGSNVKFFSIREQELNLQNIRMQSILNNYSLSITDRLILYKKVRTNEDENFLNKLVLLTTGTKITTKSSNEMGGGGIISSENPQNHVKKQSKKDDEGRRYSVLKDESENSPENTTDTLQKLEQEMVLNETGLSPFPVYHFDKYFAAGMVSTSSFTHSLLCQAYFRPFLIDTVQRLVQKVNSTTVPKGFAGKRYGEMFTFFLERGFICVGLYRRGTVSFDVREANSLPYVYTNTKADEVVNNDDLVFVIEKTI